MLKLTKINKCFRIIIFY